MRWSDVDWYGNALRDWVIAVAVAIGALVVVALLRLLLRKRVSQKGEQASEIDRFLLDLIGRTNLALLILPAFHFALRTLELPHRADTLLRVAAILTFLLQAALWLSGFADFWFGRYKRSHQNDPSALTTITAVAFMAKIALWAVILLVGLDNLGFNVTALVTGLGIGGVAVALATQNILADLFASLSIVVDKPFVIGDLITVGEHTGTVEYIGLKTTRVRSVNGEQIVFGNGDLLKSVIRNMQRIRDRRIVFRLALSHANGAEAVDNATALLRRVTERQEGLSFERVTLQRITPAGLEFDVTTHLRDSSRNASDVQHETYLAMYRELHANGVMFARTPEA